MNDWMILLYLITLIIVACEAGFLILAPCYRTGVYGAAGLFLVLLAASTVIFDTMAGASYVPIKQTLLAWMGISLYLGQTIWRARRYALASREAESLNSHVSGSWPGRKIPTP